jgi:hypothetical protein
MSYLTLVMLALEILNPSDAGLGTTFMVGATCLACAAHVALSPNLPYCTVVRTTEVWPSRLERARRQTLNLISHDNRSAASGELLEVMLYSKYIVRAATVQRVKARNLLLYECQ